MMNVAAEQINGRYRLSRQIGVGGMGVVYEAVDRLTGEHVALKRVSPGGSRAMRRGAQAVDIEILTLHLAREFQLLASLRHPNIISVLDYGIERLPEDGESRLYYTMELLHDSRSIITAAEGQPIGERVRLLVELFEALTYLHRRGILHCDLKPENVLVSESGTVKVVDFGLSSLRGQIENPTSGQIAGTLAYMSPELLRGGYATEASDLYAAGIIAFEALCGKYPYDNSSASALVRAILDTEPDFTPLYFIDLPTPSGDQGQAAPSADADSIILSEQPTLPGIVRKLMAKQPQDRYPRAQAVIADMAAAGLPIHPESQDVRESYLQAAHFVGRQPELDRLRGALASVLDGKGSAWLIGGESGIGKSRLLNELRTYALISGAQVLTGQAVEGGGLLFQVWREPLRRLALTTPLTDLEAGVLKDLIPDIDALLERPVRDAPALDGRGENQRLLRTILDVFRQQTAPTVLLLEDLHWARESLDALRTLLPLVQHQPLLIVGTYRLDEHRHLPSTLPEMTAIRLERLSQDEIAQLSTSMLGDGVAPGLVNMLREETEGNVLFIVEVVRTLAEDAGTLDLIGTQTLPFRAVIEGVEAILRRRLQRLPNAARPLLEAAAVAGRVIETNLLEAICRNEPDLAPPNGVADWLIICANAAVLEIFDGQWRFTHDKLRETLLVEMSDRGDMPKFSRIAALGIEAAYPDEAARASRAAVLAEHWRAAGDVEREAAALEFAATVALNSALNDQALEFIARARTLERDDPALKVRLLALLTEAYYQIGNLDRCAETAIETLTRLGYDTLDAAQRRSAPRFQLIELGWRQFIPRLGQSAQGSRRSLAALKILERLTMVNYFRNNRSEAAYFSLLSANVAETVSKANAIERAHGYTSAAVSLGSSRRGLAREFRRRADRAMATVDDPNTTMWYALGTGILSVMYAEWDEAEKRLRHCMEVARSSGNIRRLEEGCVSLAGAYYYQSRWEETRVVNNEMHGLAERYGDLQALGWSLDNIGRFALREGRLDEARETFHKGREIYGMIHDTINGVWCLGGIAKSYLSEHNLDRARPFVALITSALRDVPQTSFGMTEPFSAAAEYYLLLWEQERLNGTSVNDGLVEEARAAVAALGRYADIFVLARPRYYAFLGWMRRLEGSTRDAVRAGSQGVSEAARLKMPYDEAVAAIELARHFPHGELRREAWLKRAIDILEPLGASVDLGHAQRLLYNPEER